MSGTGTRAVEKPVALGMRGFTPAGGPGRQPPSALRGFAWVVVALNVLVILWGTVVRATGSGNGCGDHWPLCNGTVVQHWQTAASMIEFAHRASAGVATVALVILLVWIWRTTPRRHLARIFVAASMVLTFNEALLGALLVKLGLTARNQSPERGVFLCFHFANTLLLLAAVVLTAHFLARSVGRMRGGVELSNLAVTLPALGLLLLVGVSGSLAALGDTLYPAHTLAAAFAQDFAPGGHWMLHLRWIHPALALLAAGAVLFLAGHALKSGQGGRLPGLIAALLATQIVLGIGDVLLLAPTWLQVLHLLGADLLWIALVIMAARTSIRPLGCVGVACSGRKAPARMPQEPAESVIGA